MTSGRRRSHGRGGRSSASSGHNAAVDSSDPRWKTALCSRFRASGVCYRGNSCSFAHGEQELRRFGQQVFHPTKQPQEGRPAQSMAAARPVSQPRQPVSSAPVDAAATAAGRAATVAAAQPPSAGARCRGQGRCSSRAGVQEYVHTFPKPTPLPGRPASTAAAAPAPAPAPVPAAAAAAVAADEAERNIREAMARALAPMKEFLRTWENDSPEYKPVSHKSIHAPGQPGSSGAAAAAAAAAAVPEFRREAARADGTFAAAEAAEWAHREAVVAAQALEARRLKAERRTAAEVERRAQVASNGADAAAVAAAAAPECCREAARTDVTFAAVEAAEWVQREAVVKAHALEARRLKAQRRTAAEVERRAQVRLDEHRREELARKKEGNQRNVLRMRASAILQLRLAACKTLSAVLRRLGVAIEGDPLPTQEQILKAQKKALIRYHPDRHHGATMEAQVEAEEIFKIISDGVL